MPLALIHQMLMSALLRSFSLIRVPFIVKYQHNIENRNILTSDSYNDSMITEVSLMLKPQIKQMMVFVVTVFLFLFLLLSSVWNLRDVEAATTTAPVQANIISMINMVAQNGIVFGDISTSAIPGTVTIATNASRTTTGGATVNSNTSSTPAQFEVSGDPNALYNITLPSSIVLTSLAGDNMIVNNFSSAPDRNGQLDAGGRQNMYVGATLNVGSFQAFGVYTGVMSATVEYN